MIIEPGNLATVILAAALVVGAPAAQAARINGKQCAGMVSEQVNPITGKKTYACRAVDGTIASGSTVEERAKREPRAAPGSDAPAVSRTERAAGTGVK